jgi:hypothetical protein
MSKRKKIAAGENVEGNEVDQLDNNSESELWKLPSAISDVFEDGVILLNLDPDLPHASTSVGFLLRLINRAHADPDRTTWRTSCLLWHRTCKPPRLMANLL